MKYKNKAIHINTLLHKKHSNIANLYKKSLLIYEFDQKLKARLAPTLREHFDLANINADTATIITSSQTWATRLRGATPVILEIINNEFDFQSVKTVKVQVRKPDVPYR